MKEETTVRNNMMEDKYYAPYCGSVFPSHPNYKTCSSPRTRWDDKLSQVKCPECGWISDFPQDFIDKYKAKHELK